MPATRASRIRDRWFFIATPRMTPSDAASLDRLVDDWTSHTTPPGAEIIADGEWPVLAYFVENLEIAAAAISCQPWSQSPIPPMNRRRVDQNDLGSAQYEIASPP